MKNVCFLLLASVIFILYNCEKEKEAEKTDSLKFVETLYGGCNGISEKSAREIPTGNDTIIVHAENDTLNIGVGINYVCCAYFEGKSEKLYDTLQITVTDTCSSADHCYCHCMCYYTFDFRYTGLESGDYPCKVRLWNAMIEEYRILFTGTINITSGNQ